jgi:hypothetical protein
LLKRTNYGDELDYGVIDV